MTSSGGSIRSPTCARRNTRIWAPTLSRRCSPPTTWRWPEAIFSAVRRFAVSGLLPYWGRRHGRHRRHPMTPQERELVAELFDRLVALESAPREPDAERIIAEGLRRAPHAIYPLVQTVLVQDEALKAADARIRELEAAAGGQATDQGRGERGGFLDGMRGSVIGRREAPRWGSVPTVQPAAAPGGPAGAGAPMQPMPPMAPSAFGGGSSFLGTAAAAAAGMV